MSWIFYENAAMFVEKNFKRLWFQLFLFGYLRMCVGKPIIMILHLYFFCYESPSELNTIKGCKVSRDD